MNTMYGDIKDDLCELTDIETVGDLRKFLRTLPSDIPVGFHSPQKIAVFNAPSSPCVIIYNSEEEGSGEPF